MCVKKRLFILSEWKWSVLNKKHKFPFLPFLPHTQFTSQMCPVYQFNAYLSEFIFLILQDVIISIHIMLHFALFIQ